MKTFPKFLLSTIALAAAASANADTTLYDPVTVNLSAWTYGSGNHVDVGIPGHKGPAGGFKGTLSGAYSDSSFETYCVEITESFGLPSGDMNGYKILQGSDYSQWAAGTAGKLGQLMTYATPLVTNAVESTGLQLAIWEVIYEGNVGYSLTGGTFQDSDSSASRTFGNTLLAGFLNTQSLYSVDVLTKDGSQDFMVMTPVPEPEGYALAFAGLACIGLFGRKFRATKKA